MVEKKFNMLKAIKDFYNDDDFKQVKQFYGRTTVFDILKIQRFEIRHSAFICWLLDVTASHDLGEEPLKKFLRTAVEKADCDWMDLQYPDVRNILIVGDYTVSGFSIKTERKVETSDKSGRIDVYVEFCIKDSNDEEKKVKVIIENKVWTEVHDDQTKTYKDGTKADVVIGVFLSPGTSEKKQEILPGETDSFRYSRVTYQDLMENVLEPLQNEEMAAETAMLLRDYIVNLGKPAKEDDEKLDTVMATPVKIQNMLSRLYMSHRNLLVMALYSGSEKNDEKYKKKIIEGDKELGLIDDEIYAIDKDNKDALTRFFKANKMYLQLIFRYNGIDDPEYINAWSVLLGIALSRELSIFRFDGKEIKGKSILVHTIIHKYLQDNREITIDELHKLFEDKLPRLHNGGHVVDRYKEAIKIPDDKKKGGGNYYTDEDKRLDVNGEKLVVWKYWPLHYFQPFMEIVRDRMHYEVEEL